MKKYAAPPSTQFMEAPAGPLPPLDVEELLAKGGLILKREIHNLLMKSAAGKLAPADARDVVSYIKLLHELKEDEQEKLSNMTDEELLKLKQD